MPSTVKLDSSGRHEAAEIAEALREAGAVDVYVDTRTGDGGQTSDWFYISFTDPDAPDALLRQRISEGSHLVPCPESPIGFTRMTLGSDDCGRAAHYMKAVGHRFGGRLDDFRTGEVERFAYDAEIAAELEAPSFCM